MEESQPAVAEPIKSVLERVKIPCPARLMKIFIPKVLLGSEYQAMLLIAVQLGEIVFMGIPMEAIAKVGLVMKKSASGMSYKYLISRAC